MSKIYRDSLSDKALFAAQLALAVQSDEPVYLGRVALSAARVAELRAEGQARTEMNRRRLGARFKADRQYVGDCPLTVDELGRLAEGAIEMLVPVRAAAVVDGTDPDADIMLKGLSLDIKATWNRPSFAVADYRAEELDAVVLVELTRDRKLHVWAGKACKERWEKKKSTNGGSDFYLIRVEEPQKTLH